MPQREAWQGDERRGDYPEIIRRLDIIDKQLTGNGSAPTFLRRDVWEVEERTLRGEIKSIKAEVTDIRRGLSWMLRTVGAAVIVLLLNFIWRVATSGAFG